MKILQISAGLNPAAARSNAYLDALPKALAALGHEITVMHMAELGPWRKGFHLEIQEGAIRTVAVRSSGVYAGLPPGAGIGTAQPLREVVSSDSLRSAVAGVVEQIRPDVVHLQNLFGFPIELLLELRLTNVAVAMTEHGYFPICPTVHLFRDPGEPCDLTRDELTCSRCCVDSQNYTTFRVVQSLHNRIDKMERGSAQWKLMARFRNAILRTNRTARRAFTSDEPYRLRFDAMVKALHELDLFHCISHVQARRFQQATGELLNLTVMPLVPPTMTSLAPVPRQRSAGERIRFAVLNVFSERGGKGWAYLHAVLARLAKERADFHVDWYADGTSTARVSYRGRYAAADLDRIADETDFCVMPSLWLETLGFSGLEMLARGVPLICSDRCGVSESVCDRKNGIIFDPSHEDNLFRVLTEVLDAPEKATQMRAVQSEACRGMKTFGEHVLDMSFMFEQLVSRKSRQTVASHD